jgi:hypothetical protein
LGWERESFLELAEASERALKLLVLRLEVEVDFLHPNLILQSSWSILEYI